MASAPAIVIGPPAARRAALLPAIPPAGARRYRRRWRDKVAGRGAAFGRAVVYGLASGEPAPIVPVTLMRPCQMVGGFHLDTVMADPARLRAMLEDLFGRVAAGQITPRIDRAFPLTDPAGAQIRLASREAMGKIVIVP